MKKNWQVTRPYTQLLFSQEFGYSGLMGLRGRPLVRASRERLYWAALP